MAPVVRHDVVTCVRSTVVANDKRGVVSAGQVIDDGTFALVAKSKTRHERHVTH
jgi:hypothetical protein